MKHTVESPARAANTPGSQSIFTKVHFKTADVEEACGVLGQSFTKNSIRPSVKADGSFRCGHSLATSHFVSIGYTEFGTDVDVLADPSLTSYLICVPVTGRVVANCGNQSTALLPGRGAILPPTMPFSFAGWTGGSRLLGVRVMRDELEEHLSTLIERPVTKGVQFKFEMDTRAGKSATLLRVIKLIEAELEQPAGMSSDRHMADWLSRMLLTSLLTSQPHNYSDALDRPALKPASESPIKLAIDFIQSEPDRISTVAEIAQAARISVRALEEGFKKYIGLSPMRYLRDVKLARVHHELVRADPLSGSVTREAQRWGFTHVSRFAEAYRQKYGVSPSQTLHDRRKAIFPDPPHGGSTG